MTHELSGVELKEVEALKEGALSTNVSSSDGYPGGKRRQKRRFAHIDPSRRTPLAPLYVWCILSLFNYAGWKRWEYMRGKHTVLGTRGRCVHGMLP